jgi:hypothetical protein
VREIDGVKLNSKKKDTLRSQGSEHKRNKRPSNREKHEKGQAQKNPHVPSWKKAQLEKILRDPRLDGLDRGVFAGEIDYARRLWERI